ncbi:MAG: hypothetical protein IIB38_04540 [Candidatus Hydrogenedentes bacterium]|nr:hypothetical protein [Candidatus Hydrogenedentota bacterium]
MPKRDGEQPTEEPTGDVPQAPAPVQRPANPDEQAQLQKQIAQQRGRAEVAVLKQRFAETDVAMTIAVAERDQLVQQNQILQQENVRLTEELAALTTDREDGKEDNPSNESEDGQTTPAESTSESED